jgi:PAS domain S-box-containing protein
MSFEKRLLLIFLCILAILALVSNAFIKSQETFKETNALVEHTKEVIYESERVNFLVKKIENDSRSFIIAGNTMFLDSFEHAAQNFIQHVSSLRSLTFDNSLQQKRIDTLESLAKERVAFAKQLISERQNKGFENAKILFENGRGTALSNQLQILIGEMQKEEHTLLEKRKAENKKSVGNSNQIFLILAGAVLLIILFTGIFIIFTFRARKKAEDEVFESREWFRKTLSCIGDGVIATDKEAKITFLNPVAEKLSGWTFEEAKGKPLETVFEIVNENTRQTVVNPVQKVLQSREIVELANHTALIRKDRTEVAISDSAAPIIGIDNELIGAVLVFRNVEFQREAERALKKSKERFFKIFYSAPIPMCITEAKSGKFLYVNDSFSKMILKNGENPIGKTSIEMKIISPKERAESVEKIKQDNQHQGVETKIRSTDGEEIELFLNSNFLEIDGEEGILSCFIDITERKNKEKEIADLNAELAKSIQQYQLVNKELESFSYSVSHDLRAPLRSIDGYTRILMEDYGTKIDSEGQRLMNTVMNNAQKMGKLIDDLLAFSRLGKQSLIKTNLNMSAIFENVIKDLQHSNIATKVQFDLQPLPPARGDLSLITQVVVNLISNAVKYSSKKDQPMISIGSYMEGNDPVYFIKDNGTGFDMKYYDKLFGVFQRLHRSNEFEGTGVGLAIVQRIVNRHAGKVWAEAEPEKGATFFFTLPSDEILNHK